MDKLAIYQEQLAGRSAEEILRWALQEFGREEVSLATSFGIEDQVLTYYLSQIDAKAQIFTLDTGRNFQETYEVMQTTMDTYGIHFDVYAPEAAAIAEMVSSKGPNLFYNSIEDRKHCCDVRKLRPLAQALSKVQAWITGLRGEQSITRLGTKEIEWDAMHGIYKINPLCSWSEAQTWEFAKENKIPYNKLHDQGFPSIGCQPCTRAIKEGEGVRDGRWWWEKPESKECGLHKR
ncbi:MAG: phosphoadenylyl-sulfate reductase [SAR324 cluster bacterium]|uniref:Adenosine 5'-phosphosulfate reductase n=1 Tax=SAR324 cluster bacterium TaxID=2024889 RepID=A0A2A4SZI1_9DELT|nr:MAG: phosphoadenylyl-sulfate reductase [SAR324 cluster bacterium]